MKQNFTVSLGALDGVEAFLSVAQHRSFRKATAELGVTTSAISQAVRTLASCRTTRSVGLTEAGERFLSRAKPALLLSSQGSGCRNKVFANWEFFRLHATYMQHARAKALTSLP